MFYSFAVSRSPVLAASRVRSFLADRAEQLAADVLLAGLAVAHHALARADHGDAHAVEHLGELFDLVIDAATGLAEALDLVDDLLARHRVLELHAELALLAVVDHIVFLDVTFVLEHLGDAGADLALVDEHELPADPVGVPDAGEHVRDGVLVVHRFRTSCSLSVPVVVVSFVAVTSWPFSGPGFCRRARARGA